MITGDIKQKVDAVWQTFWNNGFTQPSAIFEQMTYLLFMKMMDKKLREKKSIANLIGDVLLNPTFPKGTLHNPTTDQNVPYSDQDIARLEPIFWEELGSKEEFEEQTRTKFYQHNVAAFIRSIIGLEQDVALEKYRALIHGAELPRMQEEYLRTLIRYVCENGDTAPVVLQQPPFNKFTTIFRDSPKSLIDVWLISQVIAA